MKVREKFRSMLSILLPRRLQRLLKVQPLLVIHREMKQKAATERANTMAMLTGERAKHTSLVRKSLAVSSTTSV